MSKKSRGPCPHCGRPYPIPKPHDLAFTAFTLHCRGETLKAIADGLEAAAIRRRLVKGNRLNHQTVAGWIDQVERFMGILPARGMDFGAVARVLEEVGHDHP